jgi:hypothetical protein
VKFQRVNDYLYVTLWDKQYKRPKRFYLGRSTNNKLAELLNAAGQLSVDPEEIRDYLERQMDPATCLTRTDLVVLALVLGAKAWQQSTDSTAR